jgi:hypothetical protein
MMLSLCAAAAICSTALAVPDYGHEWRTIGDPGNPPTDFATKHPNFPRPLGAVDYEYRLTRTEVTYAQQLEFLNAYGPYMEQGTGELRGWGEISYFGMGANGPIWDLNVGSENRPGKMSARLWMRYCNWLHNDQALTEDAFESGAYDASTFGTDADGNLTDQMTRSPGARFWIPSIDEWVKGGYWDPNRYGEGEGGYWRYPYMSDEPPIPGPPEEGGQTNAVPGDVPLDVGSYPDAQTPWGLLDYSGGQMELAERINDVFYLKMGSNVGSHAASLDRLGRFGSAIAISGVGLRVASVVPSPGSGALLALAGAVATRRRR